MLSIRNLNKRYGKYLAVNDLRLDIPEGEIFGFVGPNGAGKTTTMKIICGLLTATSGEVLLDGVDIIKKSRYVREKIGYMPDFFGVYDDLKVGEYLDFYASTYKMKADERKKRVEDLLELIDLSHKRDIYVDTLSRGMKQRLCLARSLVHDPRLLVLDEPASGMDPRARAELKTIIRTLKEQGKTILISSHILPELAELCTQIGIIDKGQMVISGTVSEIMDKVYGSKVLSIKVLDKAEEAVKILKEMPDIDKVTANENIIKADFEGSEEAASRLLAVLVGSGIPIAAFGQAEGNLEDIFLKVTKGENA